MPRKWGLFGGTPGLRTSLAGSRTAQCRMGPVHSCGRGDPTGRLSSNTAGASHERNPPQFGRYGSNPPSAAVGARPTMVAPMGCLFGRSLSCAGASGISPGRQLAPDGSRGDAGDDQPCFPAFPGSGSGAGFRRATCFHPPAVGPQSRCVVAPERTGGLGTADRRGVLGAGGRASGRGGVEPPGRQAGAAQLEGTGPGGGGPDRAGQTGAAFGGPDGGADGPAHEPDATCLFRQDPAAVVYDLLLLVRLQPGFGDRRDDPAARACGPTRAGNSSSRCSSR